MFTADVITAILLLFAAMIVIQVFIHFFMIEVLHTKPIYLEWFIARGTVAIFHAAMFQLMDLWQWLPILIWQLVVHFIIFNPLLNKLRYIKQVKEQGSSNYHFAYMGEDSGWLDKMFRADPNFYRLCYIACCIIFVIDTVVLYNLYV